METDVFLKRLRQILNEWDSGERDAERAMEIVSCLMRELESQHDISRQ
jgi:hypothetical protein